MLVLTQWGTERPRATAFRARRPAPTITDGLEVLVQLVMAAMTSVPSVISAEPVSSSTSTVRRSPFAEAAVPPAPEPPLACGSGMPGRSPGRSCRKLERRPVRAMRSCGRFGPATDGSTVERSISSRAVYSGSGVSSVRKRPCSFV